MRRPTTRISVAVRPLFWVCILGLSATAEAAQFTSRTANYRLTYPNTWNAEANPDGRGVFLFNYPPQETPAGRMEPPGGASISVQVFPPYDNPYFPQGSDDYTALDTFARNETVITRTSPSSGQPARLTSVADAVNTRLVRTAFHKAGKVFFLILDCNADDRQVAAYEQVLNDVIAGMLVRGITAPRRGATTDTMDGHSRLPVRHGLRRSPLDWVVASVAGPIPHARTAVAHGSPVGGQL